MSKKRDKGNNSNNNNNKKKKNKSPESKVMPRMYTTKNNYNNRADHFKHSCEAGPKGRVARITLLNSPTLFCREKSIKRDNFKKKVVIFQSLC